MKKNRSKLQKAIQTPGRAFMNIIYRFPSFSAKLDDEKYVKFIYKWCFKKNIDLDHPRTFSEKLQWIKLYDHNELYTRIVDKYAVKEYIASLIGEEYIIPTIGVWNSFDEIDFNVLPDAFVLKCTHDSGGLVICKDKSKLDIKKARKKIVKSLKRNFYLLGREWPYKDVKPQIIAEPYISDSNGELNDYKFFCFNGQPKMLFIASDRGIDTRFDFFDMDFNHLPFEQGHPNSAKSLKKPDGFDQMKELSMKLSKGFPEVRVDFYNVDGKIYFGELTLFHFSGFVPFEPEEWDRKLGEWIELPQR